MPANQPMNVLLLVSDQHRWNTAGYAGHPIVQTPHLDRLAASGLHYSNAYCAAPLCGPSRAAFLTGTHSHTNGILSHNNTRHRTGREHRYTLNPSVHSLVSDFARAGYDTLGAGFMHVDKNVHNPDDPFGELGFTKYRMSEADYVEAVGADVARRYNMARTGSEMWEHTYRNVEGDPFPHGEEKMYDTLITDACLDMLSEREGDKPFVMYAGYRAPHPPWCAPPEFHAMYDPDDIGELPNYNVRYTDKPRRVIERVNYYELWNLPEEMIRRSIAGYYAFVSYLDHHMGRLIDGLEQRGLRENTLIVYTSDHGEMLYHNGICEKHTFFEGSVRIPLIMSLPGVIESGSQSDALVSNIDLLPTLMTMADLDVPDFVEGVDQTPTFSGGEVRDNLCAEYYHSLDPSRMVRDKRHKYIHTEDDICELYDLENDPQESLNLAWYEPYAEKVAAMDALVMRDWEVPDVPLWGTWNDLNERKQKLRLSGREIIDPRPALPDWAKP